MSAPEVAASAAGEPRIIQFGVFEVDRRSGELRKGEIPVRLAAQSFRILELLLERPGDLVTREELIGELWPGDTFVDFDRSLNAAVKKLRRALGDSPRNPRFVETLPRRGYRFIASEEIVYSGNGAEGIEIPAGPALQSHPSRGEKQASPMGAVPHGAIRRPPRTLVSVWLGSLAVLASVVLWLGMRTNHTIHAVTARAPWQARPVADLPNVAAGPVLSPDGKKVAFVWTGEEIARDPANWDIYVKRLSDGVVTRLTADPGNDLDPVWSPDAQSIAFRRFPPAGAPGTYVLSLSSGEQKRLGSGPVSWTPDGKWLVLAAEQDVHAVSIDTRERKDLLSSPPQGAYRDPVVSPDGSSLAYAMCPRTYTCAVYVRELEGGESRRLTFESGRLGGLAWTPDSRQIVYSLEGRLYRVGASGQPRATMIEFDGADLMVGRSMLPTISATTTNHRFRLSFSHMVRDIDVWMTDVTGYSRIGAGDYRKKVIDSQTEDIAPEFSPDGSRIAFLSDRVRGRRALWVCHRDGSDSRVITPATFRVGIDVPAWSPDGSRIAFRASTDEDPALQMYTVDAAGGVPRRVTTDVDVARPAWSRDGLWIYHLSKQSGRNHIWKAPSDGRGPAVAVNKMLTWAFSESPDGELIYFCGPEKPGFPYGALWRIAVAGGEPERIAFPFSFYRIIASSRGLYYLEKPNQERKEIIATLKLLDPSTGVTTEVGKVKDPMGPRHFSLSPDGRFVLTNNVGSIRSDLMVVEDFH